MHGVEKSADRNGPKQDSEGKVSSHATVTQLPNIHALKKTKDWHCSFGRVLFENIWDPSSATKRVKFVSKGLSQDGINDPISVA